MPKFKLEMSFGLDQALAAMGMPDLFDSTNADLSNITGDKSLHVSAVIHKAFVEVFAYNNTLSVLPQRKDCR